MGRKDLINITRLLTSTFSDVLHVILDSFNSSTSQDESRF